MVTFYGSLTVPFGANGRVMTKKTPPARQIRYLQSFLGEALFFASTPFPNQADIDINTSSPSVSVFH